MTIDETRLKRLRMRSWRRGTKEMDLILGPFSDGPLAALPPRDVDAYEALLEEQDQDLYLWVSGRLTAPEDHIPTLDLIRRFHGINPG